MEISQEESNSRRDLVEYSSCMIQSEGLPITDKMREMDCLYISGKIDDAERKRRALAPPGNGSQEEMRREQVAHSTRMVQSEGLPVSDRMRELDQRYISGEIDWKEYNRIQREW
jgi:predicted DNA binding protein